MIRFGATEDEARMSMPGDEVVHSPLLATTHAITINAPAEKIWPWLIQIGHQRAGFYSDSPWWDACVDFYYRMLSAGEQTRSARYRARDNMGIVPEWQNLRVGDAILDGPPGTAYYLAREIEPERSLVLFTDTHLPYLVPVRLRRRVSGELSAAYLLVVLGGGRTRLLRRMRVTCRPFPFRLVALPIVLIWGEWITARNFMRGLKRRAEGTARTG